MEYSPKLKVAAEEIKAILQKHDIGAAIVLHTPGFGEYVLKVDPSYSCAKILPRGEGFHFKANVEIYGTKEKRDQAIADTNNLFKVLADVTDMVCNMIEQGEEKLAELTKPDHDLGSHTSHEQQNN